MLLFLIPIVVIGGLVAYALVGAVFFQNGTLVVKAYSESSAGSVSPLHVSASISGRSELTPFNLSLPQGPYIVEFQSLRWYVTPANHSLFLDSGKTAYAVGIYSPVKVVIGASASGFNATTSSALHGVTPVEWTNIGSTYLVVDVETVGTLGLAPGQSYTAIFKTAGSYSYAISGSTSGGTISVS